LWDVETGQPLWQYTGITVPIQRAAFNPEGTRIAAASESSFAAILDAETGAQLRAIYTRPTWSVAFIPGTEQIVTGAVDGSVSLWHAQPIELESLINWVFENRYVPTLTCEERERYHVEPLCGEGES
jgi:WD40 repeat protein